MLRSTVYYIGSILTLLTKINFWHVPFLFFLKPVLIKTNNFSFFVWNLMDVWVIKEVVLDKQYIIKSKIKSNWIVCDIGSGIGEFDILLGKKVKHVYGFDNNKNRFLLAKQNIVLNDSRNINLFLDKIESLDHMFKIADITSCDLLKIDCEGNEYSIFRNSSAKSLRQINNITMEAHLFSPRMVREFYLLKERLRKNNFVVEEKANPVHAYLKYLTAYRN